ncbi:type III polyketide synthase [Planctomicrobium sp. SH661]|uniref:type III polyketide synthase n=1 Tax=Planctomicrobium sp. SH661 TaxID=3448124 RepID=UPI003F5BAD96
MELPFSESASAHGAPGPNGFRTPSSVALAEPESPAGEQQLQSRKQKQARVTVALAGISTAVPEHSIAQTDAAQLAAELGVTNKYRKSLDTMYRLSGVQRRFSVLLDSSAAEDVQQAFYFPATSPDDHGPSTATRMVKYEQTAADLALEASRKALESSGVPVAAVTHLVTISCSGFAAPGVDLALIDQLGLSPDVERAHVGFMGCHGALNGLRVARGWAAADPDACVLVCAVELCSLHHQYTEHAQQLVANALFSDGACAFIVQQNSLEETDCRLVSQASHVIAETAEMMSWKIADHGFQMTLSPKVPEVIVQTLKPWLEGWLAKSNLRIEDIGSWAVHPGGPRILAATAKALELQNNALQHSEAILASHGNMSSPTVFFILERIRAMGESGPTVMLGFGPGLTIEAALLEW